MVSAAQIARKNELSLLTPKNSRKITKKTEKFHEKSESPES